MTEWKWYASRDEERYEVGPCAAREHAIEEGRDYYGEDFVVAECLKGAPNLDLFSGLLDADRVLEALDEQNEEVVDGDGDATIFCRGITAEERRDLEASLNAALKAWLGRHGIETVAWAFAGVRNIERVSEPAHEQA